MIKIQESVPSVYYHSSRDFQLIGHLFDLVLNAVKTDADLLFNLPLSINSDDLLLDLMAYTFGLQLDRSRYTSKQLRAIYSVAPQMMRSKGSRKAVELLCTALMHVDGLEDNYAVQITEDGKELNIYISDLASCKEILQEMLPYIVPAGMVFNIVRSKRFSEVNISDTFGMTDTVTLNNSSMSSHFDHFDESDINEIIKPNIFTESSETSLALKPNLAIGAVLFDPKPKNDNGG